MNPAREQPTQPRQGRWGDLRAAVLPHRRTRMTPRPPLLRTDPAEALYREQVRRDVEAAHKWLAAQVTK